MEFKTPTNFRLEYHIDNTERIEFEDYKALKHQLDRLCNYFNSNQPNIMRKCGYPYKDDFINDLNLFFIRHLGDISIDARIAEWLYECMTTGDYMDTYNTAYEKNVLIENTGHSTMCIQFLLKVIE